MNMAGEIFGFVAFRSRQQTTAFESALKKQGINCRIINTPHEIGMGCGLSVRFNMEDMKAAMLISDRMHQSALIGFYSAENTNGKLICKPVTKVMRYCN
jgi:hypothetical protein